MYDPIPPLHFQRTVRYGRTHRPFRKPSGCGRPKIDKAARAQNGIELELPGYPQIIAQTPLNVLGPCPELTGD